MKLWLLTYVENFWDGCFIKPVAILTDESKVDETIASLIRNKEFVSLTGIPASKLSRSNFEVQEFNADEINLNHEL